MTHGRAYRHHRYSRLLALERGGGSVLLHTAIAELRESEIDDIICAVSEIRERIIL